MSPEGGIRAKFRNVVFMECISGKRNVYHNYVVVSFIHPC